MRRRMHDRGSWATIHIIRIGFSCGYQRLAGFYQFSQYMNQVPGAVNTILFAYSCFGHGRRRCFLNISSASAGPGASDEERPWSFAFPRIMGALSGLQNVPASAVWRDCFEPVCTGGPGVSPVRASPKGATSRAQWHSARQKSVGSKISLA